MSMLIAGVEGCSSDQGTSGNSSLTIYGNVDIREVQLSFQDGGLLQNVLVEEGARVHKGQVIAELDPRRYQLEVQRLTGQMQAQEEQLNQLEAGSRPQEIDEARATVAAAQATLRERELLYERKRELLTINRISKQDVDSAKAGKENAQAALQTAQAQLSLAIAGPRQETIKAARATLQSLQAAKQLAEQRLVDTRLTAPADGVIRNRILEPGALAVAGSPVLSLALTNPLWVRAYVSEPDLGRIHEGMRAHVQTDSFPDKQYEGWVGFVSSTAEFTPKTVETTELRTKLVYRTKVFVCNPEDELRLGMPVTVTLEAENGKSVQKKPCAE